MLRILTLLVATFVVASAQVATAQTIGYAEAIDRLSAACGKDINTHCKGVSLGNNRIGQCLQKNSSKISGQCKSTYATVYDLLAKRAAAQDAVGKICDADIRQLCKGVKAGRGHILRCMLKAEKRVSDKCNQAITDAGYR